MALCSRSPERILLSPVTAKEAKNTMAKDSSATLDYYRKRSPGSQLHFDKVPSVTPVLKTPDVGQRTWKERSGDILLSTFSLTPCYIGWHGIIHGGITSGIIDDEAIAVAKAEALFVLCKQLPEQPKIRSLLPRDRACKRIPQELWNMVIEYLPSLTGKYAAQAFGFKLEEQHEKHAGVWDRIIREEDAWTPIAIRQGLNPVLIGDGLHTLFNDPTQPAYICLSTGDKTRNIRHDQTKLLASLREHHFNENGEVVFHDSKIILNIDEALYNPFFVTLTPKRLFSCRNNRLCSASLYWADSQYALRTIGPDDIVGIGEKVSTLKDVSHICGITLTHPTEMALRQRHQQCFQHPSCPPTYPVLSLEYNGDNMLGWEWEDGVEQFWRIS